LNLLATETGLLVAAVIPVVVVGWSIVFSVEAARRGAAWSHRHLSVMATVFKLAFSLAIVVVLVVRPIWVGLGVAYPLGVALMLVLTRQRQLAAVERDMGFGEIRPEVRQRLLDRLRRGLVVVAALSFVIGGSLATVGVVQGWVVAALAPIALVALARTRLDEGQIDEGQIEEGQLRNGQALESELGGQVPPSL